MALNWSRMDPEKAEIEWKRAVDHLLFAISLYRIQMEEGRLFLHEHPDGASSWSEQEVEEVLKLQGVVRSTLDMCAYNLRTTGPEGDGLAKKTTEIMTNNADFANFLSKRCDGNHDHIPLIGGQSICPSGHLYT